jgi:hypothetical protein
MSMNDNSPALSSLRKTFGRISKGWDTLAVPQSLADERREVRWTVGLEEMVDRNPVAADVAGRVMRHRDGAHFCPASP